MGMAPETLSPQSESDRTLIKTSIPTALLVFASLFAIAVLLQVRNGAYANGFGGTPDESAHYVTGLMVYKYVTHGLGTNPMTFAERFYTHYPAVAFGHWPPLFYVLQAMWGLVFGLSRISVLLLMASLTAVLSTLIYAVVAVRVSSLYGLLFGGLATCLPIVQWHTGVIMSEVPLTICTLVAILAYERLIESPSQYRALWAGFWLASAILVKGNGWALLAVPAFAVLLAKRRVQFLLRYLPATLIPVVLLCAPITLLTMKMTKDGWDQSSPTFAFVIRALPSLFVQHIDVIGVPLVILAAIGVFAKVISPFFSGKQYSVFWMLCLFAIGSVLLFHSVVPAGIEPRKLFMSIPFLLFFAAAGLKRIVDALPQWRLSSGYATAVAILIGISLVARAHPIVHTNMGPAAQDFLSHASSKSAVFVATTSRGEGEELSFVAEIASRENGNLNHAVIRAGKLLADSSWTGSDYKLIYPEDRIDDILRSIPVSAVVLYVGKGGTNGHGPLVERSMSEHPLEWAPIEDWKLNSGKVQLMFSRGQVSKILQLPPINLDRKLGRRLAAQF